MKRAQKETPRRFARSRPASSRAKLESIERHGTRRENPRRLGVESAVARAGCTRCHSAWVDTCCNTQVPDTAEPAAGGFCATAIAGKAASRDRRESGIAFDNRSIALYRVL